MADWGGGWILIIFAFSRLEYATSQTQNYNWTAFEQIQAPGRWAALISIRGWLRPQVPTRNMWVTEKNYHCFQNLETNSRIVNSKKALMREQYKFSALTHYKGEPTIKTEKFEHFRFSHFQVRSSKIFQPSAVTPYVVQLESWEQE